MRVYSGFIKDIEEKPSETPWGKKMPIGQVLVVVLMVVVLVVFVMVVVVVFVMVVLMVFVMVMVMVLVMVVVVTPLQVMGEFSNSPAGGGWVHGVSFSADGGRLAWVSHDSSISVADAKNGMAVQRSSNFFIFFYFYI